MVRSSVSAWLIIPLSLVVGCGSSDDDILDSGGAPDLGAETLDAAASNDSGQPTDAGTVDSGTAPDAGNSVDAGLEADTGVDLDSGVEPDSGVPPDAGIPCPIGIDDTIEATLRVTVDDDRRVWFNQIMLDDFVASRTWHTVTTTVVQVYRHPSRANVIAVHAENRLKVDGLDRGVLLDLIPTSTTVGSVVTDASWKVNSSTVADFETEAFDDSGWDFATEEAQHPNGPYADIFGTSDAWWIWFYDSALPAAQKPAAETMATRRKFYILMDGQISSTPGTCP